jgi:hypothetical protein
LCHGDTDLPPILLVAWMSHYWNCHRLASKPLDHVFVPEIKAQVRT